MAKLAMRQFTDDDYEEWTGAECFDDRPEGRDAPLIGEHPAGWIVIASDGVVGVYPSAEPYEGWWLRNDTEGYAQAIEVCALLAESDGSPKALRALGFIPEAEL